MSTSDNSLPTEHHISADLDQPIILPKVRADIESSAPSASRTPSINAVPATPRMLRNGSGSLLQQQQQQKHLSQGPQGSSKPHQYTQGPSFTPGSQQRHTQEPLLSPQRSNSGRIQRTPSSAARYNQYQSPAEEYTTASPSRQGLPQLDTQMTTAGHTPPQRSSLQKTNSNNGLLPAANVPNDNQLKESSQNKSPNKRPPQGQFHRRSIGEWDFMKTVGAGSMGKVKLAKHRRTAEVCAIKIVPRAARIYERNHANAPPSQDEAEHLKRKKEYEKEVARDRRTIREASLGKILYHPFICRLFEVITMSNHYYMLFEYVSGGQMLDYIVSHGSLKERHARKFARGIGSALDYLHRNNVVHRDLKIENIMISKTGDIKIIDFGLSNMYSNDSLLKTYCGSLYFAAPELLCAHPYIGPEVDVWSFGVVLFVLVCGKVPFDDQSVSSLHEKIKKGRVEYPSFLSVEVINLLSRMLVVNPNKRARLPEVLSHPWIMKGYETQPSSFVPYRTPLTLPLDSNILTEMVALELAESEEQVSVDLTRIIQSDIYAEASKHWYQSQDTSATLKVDPTTGFHPLVSIYYLVDEMLKRKKAKESIIDIPSSAEYQEQQVQGNSREDTPEVLSSLDAASQLKPEINVDAPDILQTKYQTPTQQPVLSFPEAVHTSPSHSNAPPLPDPQQILTANTSGTDETGIPQQHKQHDSPDEKGFNSLIRKFSQLRSKRAHDSLVQRTNSVNIGAIRDPNMNPNNDYTVSSKYQGFGNNDRTAQRVSSLRVKKTDYGRDELRPELPDVPQQNVNKTHNRAVSAYTGGTVRPAEINTTANKPSSTLRPTKFHPSARAKSVGHRRDHPQFNNSDSHAGEIQQVPPLPADLNDDAFFDDITLDEYPNSDKATLVNSNTSAVVSHAGSSLNRRPTTNADLGELNEEQIMEDANKAPAGSMPSIEFPRTLFLKGFFSVQTTSTKPLPVIRASIISVLTKLDVQFTEVRGGFVCQHVPSIKQIPSPKETASLRSAKSSDTASGHLSNSIDKTIQTRHQGGDNSSLGETSVGDNAAFSTPTSASKSTHRRKFSIGGSILGYRRKPSISAAPAIPPTPVAASSYNQYDFDSSASLDSLNNEGANGGSDMLISSRIEQNKARAPSSTLTENVNTQGVKNTGEQQQTSGSGSIVQSRTPLKFEIHVVKVPLVGLYGVQFKKVLGNTWMYKALAGQILNELNL